MQETMLKSFMRTLRAEKVSAMNSTYIIYKLLPFRIVLIVYINIFQVSADILSPVDLLI